MKVLFLTHSFPRRVGDTGGVAVLRLASALRNEDIEVNVVAPAAPGAAERDSFENISIDRFHYASHRFDTLASNTSIAQELANSWSARVAMLGFLGAEFTTSVKARRAFEPDLIHAHWWFPNGLVGTWVARMSSRPLVTTLHGADVRLARTVAFSRPGFRHVMHHSAVVTAVSRQLASEATQVVAVPSPVIAPMPVSTDLFFPGGNREKKRLLFVGRLNKQTGIELLVHALNRIPDTSVKLDVVGDGDARDSLEELARGLEVDGRIRWCGVLPQQELADLYRSAAALVVPLAREQVPYAAVEAQLCETPVVVVDPTGSSDLVEHDRTGILVRSPDAAELAAAIISLLAREDRGASLGAAARLRALATYAPESVARRYADIYRSAVARSAK